MSSRAPMNILETLRADHRSFLGLLERLDRTVTGSGERYYTSGWSAEVVPRASGILDELIGSLARHERAEARLLFPAVRRHAPEADAAVEGLLADHGGLGRLLARFRRELPSSRRPASWLILGLCRVANSLRSHIAREEAEVYAAAARKVPRAELERLGRSASRGRRGDGGEAPR